MKSILAWNQPDELFKDNSKAFSYKWKPNVGNVTVISGKRECEIKWFNLFNK